MKPRLLGEVIMDGGESVLCNADDSELGKLQLGWGQLDKVDPPVLIHAGGMAMTAQDEYHVGFAIGIDQFILIGHGKGG